MYLVTFFPPASEIGEKSRDKTRHRRIVRPTAFNGACTMRAHEEKSASPDAFRACGESTGLAPLRTQRVPPLLVSLSIPEDSPVISPTHLPPFARKRLQKQRLCAAGSLIEMHRFHYKLLMRQICLSVSMRYQPRHCRARSLFPHIADNNINPKETNGKNRRGKRSGSVSDRC